MGMSKTARFVVGGLFMLLVGIGLVVGSYFLNAYTKSFIQNSEKTMAVIVSIDYEYIDEDRTDFEVIVEYYVDGVRYSNELGYYDSGLYVGKSVSIRYDKNNPNKIMYGENEYLVVWILAILGVVLVLGGVAMVLFSRQGQRLTL